MTTMTSINLSPLFKGTTACKREEEKESDYGIGGYCRIPDGWMTATRNYESEKVDSYGAIVKLGNGQYSTVYACRKRKTDTFTAVKILRAAPEYQEIGLAEVAIMEHVGTLSRKEGRRSKPHKGHNGFVKLIDTFVYDSPAGSHLCLSTELMAENLRDFLDRAGPLDPVFMPMIAKQLLESLEFLHDHCKLIHTDLKPQNIMLSHKSIQEFFVRLQTHRETAKVTYSGARRSSTPADRPRIEDKSEPIPVPEFNCIIKTGNAYEHTPTKYRKNFAPSRSDSSSDDSTIFDSPLQSPASLESDNETEVDVGGFHPDFATFHKSLLVGYGESNYFFPGNDQGNSEGKFLFSNYQNHLEWNRAPCHYFHPSSEPQASIEWVGQALDLKIGDLGLARPAASVNEYAKIGSFECRAPEIILQQRWDARVDVWSIGCILFECLTGRLLFHPDENLSPENKEEAMMVEFTKRLAMGRAADWVEIWDKKSSYSIDTLHAEKRFADFTDKVGNWRNFEEPQVQPILNLLVDDYKMDLNTVANFTGFLERLIAPINCRVSVRQALDDPFVSGQPYPACHVRPVRYVPVEVADQVKRKLPLPTLVQIEHYKPRTTLFTDSNQSDDRDLLSLSSIFSLCRNLWRLVL